MDVQAICTAIANTFENHDLHTYDYGPDAAIAPAVFVYPDTLPYHADFDGGVVAQFVARFLISSVMSQGGQAFLNGLISPDGARAWIEDDSTLGGTVDSAEVTAMRNYGVVQLADGATRYYSAELVIEIIA